MNFSIGMAIVEAVMPFILLRIRRTQPTVAVGRLGWVHGFAVLTPFKGISRALVCCFEGGLK